MSDNPAPVRPQTVSGLIDKWRDPEFWKDEGCRMDSKDCADELAALPPSPQGREGWQPIETAKLGETVLLIGGGWRHAFVGVPNGDHGACWIDLGADGWQTFATHWMPLPAPPGTTAARDAAPAPDMRAAVEAFLAKWPALKEAVNGAITISALHGCPYNGPNIGAEITAMQAALDAPGVQKQEE